MWWLIALLVHHARLAAATRLLSFAWLFQMLSITVHFEVQGIDNGVRARINASRCAVSNDGALEDDNHFAPTDFRAY